MEKEKSKNIMAFLVKTMRKINYQGSRWKKKRAKILRRDKFIDQIKKRYGKTQEATIVHHIYPAEYYPEFIWEDWNLISVSQQTHNRLHNRNTNELTAEGIEIMERTPIPERRKL